MAVDPLFILQVPAGEDRERLVCETCGFINYVNPKIVTGSVVTAGGEGEEPRILLCKRAIDPRRGFWTLPAGYMEERETVREAAKREAREEACAEIDIDAMLAVYDVPRISQVQIMFRARLLSDIAPGPESVEVGLFGWDEILWGELAFPSVHWALTHWRESRRLDAFVPYGTPEEWLGR